MNNRNGEEGSVNESLFIFVQFHKMLPFGRNIELVVERKIVYRRERERERRVRLQGRGEFQARISG